MTGCNLLFHYFTVIELPCDNVLHKLFWCYNLLWFNVKPCTTKLLNPYPVLRQLVFAVLTVVHTVSTLTAGSFNQSLELVKHASPNSGTRDLCRHQTSSIGMLELPISYTSRGIEVWETEIPSEQKICQGYSERLISKQNMMFDVIVQIKLDSLKVVFYTE